MANCKHPLVRERSSGRILGSLKHLVECGAPESKYLYGIDYQLIPCGQCIACRLNYSRQWAARCTCETIYHSEQWFLTITYNNDSVPTLNLETGEIDRGGYWALNQNQAGDFTSVEQSLTLLPTDLQLFLKNLRRQQEYHYKQYGTIRFYACGEYGGKTLRPHYHMLAYGLHIPDLEYYKTTNEGNEYYTSEYLNRIWGKGFIIVGKLSWNSCAYVSRYVMKKQMGKDENGLTAKDRYFEAGLQPEFVRMSLKPGIGQKYFEDHKEEIYRNDEIILPGGKKPIRMKPPKKFDEWFEEINPDKMKEVKEEREQQVKQNQHNQLKNTSLTYCEMLDTQERTLKKKMKNIRRLDNED